MTIQEQIQSEITDSLARIERLKALATLCEKMNIDNTENPRLYRGGVDWDRPSREKFGQVRALFPNGTKWSKTINGESIDYETEFKGFQFRLWAAPPPPSCQLVYEEKLVPEHVERIPKLVCH